MQYENEMDATKAFTQDGTISYNQATMHKSNLSSCVFSCSVTSGKFVCDKDKVVSVKKITQQKKMFGHKVMLGHSLYIYFCFRCRRARGRMGDISSSLNHGLAARCARFKGSEAKI